MELTKSEFLSQFKLIVDVEVEINMSTKFNDSENFDSLTLMSISVWISEKFNRNITIKTLQEISTIEDLFNLIIKG